MGEGGNSSYKMSNKINAMNILPSIMTFDFQLPSVVWQEACNLTARLAVVCKQPDVPLLGQCEQYIIQGCLLVLLL